MDTLTSWLTSARDWLDARGKSAWIAVMILGFIFFWPVGLALLFYMIWSKRMKCNSKSRQIAHRRFGSSGNVAFDSYRDETLRRLEEEQTAFESFMHRLREAKDKAEFDKFMDERRSGTSTMTPEFS